MQPIFPVSVQRLFFRAACQGPGPCRPGTGGTRFGECNFQPILGADIAGGGQFSPLAGKACNPASNND